MGAGPQSRARPWWVRAILWGLESRSSVWVCAWICMALAMGSVVYAAITGDRRWVIGGIMVGGVSVSQDSTIVVSSFGGGISNSGVIIADAIGILVGGDGIVGGSFTISTFSGGISNSGTIHSGSAGGIVVGGTAISEAGAVSNFSVVQGSDSPILDARQKAKMAPGKWRHAVGKGAVDEHAVDQSR